MYSDFGANRDIFDAIHRYPHTIVGLTISGKIKLRYVKSNGKLRDISGPRKHKSFTLLAISRDIFLFSDLLAFGEIKDCTFSVRVQIAKILRY